MENADKVIFADMLLGSLLIGFADGRQAIYSGSLLRSIFGQAKEVIPEKPGD